MKPYNWTTLPFEASIHQVPSMAFNEFMKHDQEELGGEASRIVGGWFQAAWETGYRQAMVDVKNGKLVAFLADN